MISHLSDDLANRATIAFCQRLSAAKVETVKATSVKFAVSDHSSADRMDRYNPLHFDLTRQAVLARPWRHHATDFLQNVAALTFVAHFCDGSRAFRDQDGWFAWGRTGGTSTEASTFVAATLAATRGNNLP